MKRLFIVLAAWWERLGETSGYQDDDAEPLAVTILGQMGIGMES